MGRYIFLSVLLLSTVGGIAWRTLTLHVFQKDFLRTQGAARTLRVVEVPTYRGMFLDRNGEPLAISTPVESVWLNPKEFDASHPQLLTLCGLLDISLAQLLEKFEKNATREFTYLMRHVPPKLAAQVNRLDIAGIHLKKEYRRYYPTGEVMAHLLGFTDLDDRGQEGLELVYESWLKGRSGSKRVHRDRLGREIEMLEGLQDMHPGQDVMLSLDQRLQYLAYRALKSSVKNNKAAAGAVVVLDIKTGEILAMVNQPTFNPNVRLRIRDGRYRNRALTDVFEPGSLMKTFSVVNALQYGAGRVRPDTVVDTSPGFWTVGHQVVKEDKNKNYGSIDLSMILQKSSNVGVSKLTLALPSEALINTYQHLGFGSATGSGFPGESAGSLTEPKNGSFTLATMSFGYGMNVTLLQLAQAYAVLGAEGIKKPISFLKQEAPVLGEQVISPKVAREVIQMLTHVVEQGGGVKAKVAGYQVAGKTGTVRKIDKGVYQANNHLALFAGVAPAINPRFAIAVMVDDPQGTAYYGSQVAAPIFSEIAMGALRLFNIAPDEMNSSGLRIAQISATISHE